MEWSVNESETDFFHSKTLNDQGASSSSLSIPQLSGCRDRNSHLWGEVSEGWESRWLSWVVLPQGLPWSFSQAISWGWSHISGFRGKSSSPSSLILAVLSPALCGPLWRRLPGCSHDTLFPQSEWLKKEWEITSWKRTTGLCNLFLQVTHCYVCQTLFTRRE